jgi:uridine phosphorylase
MQYPATELVLNKANQVYHLGLDPESIFDKIILVGDQDRVDLVSAQFDSITHRSQHREFKCHSGIYRNKKISVISSGIGTDNIDIVMNELDALVNIDLLNRIDLPTKKSLEIVRIGTCGILQAEIPVHAYILSDHAVGLDNIAHFYHIPFDSREEELKVAIENYLGLPAGVKPYAISADNELTDRFNGSNVHRGITITSSGFYGPQGRQLRLQTKTTDLNERIEAFQFGSERIVNFEMESSALFALSKSLGHKATTICLGIANRPKKEFSKGYTSEMVELIRFVLERI